MTNSEHGPAVCDLERQIASLRHGDHLCMVYENSIDQMAAATLYIKHGLAAGDQCVYAADEQSVDQVFTELDAAGIDVDRQQRRGALRLLTRHEAYLRSGRFDPHEMIEFFREAAQRALADQFAGFRITGEMTWALGSEDGCDRVIDCEALVNNFFPSNKAVALCQYNRQRFSAETIYDVLRTHPMAIIGDQVCSNLYYEPPELVLGSDPLRRMTDRVDWMIRQLKRTEREVAERRRAEQALREADRRKDEFLATLAHELRNPLAPIRTGLELLRIASDDPVVLQETRSTMERQTHQLVRLVDDLMDVSRITSGKLELRKSRVDLATVVQNAVETTQPILHQRQHHLSVNLPPQGVFLHADQARLSQAIANLLNNAAKYTPRGGQLHISAEREGSSVKLCVKDNGIGILPHMFEAIFEPFVQAGSTPDEYDGGLGIGLTLVKRLVELHDGSISVSSSGPGAGSEFAVRLPVEVQPDVSQPWTAVPAAATWAPRRCLVVDDNRDAARMLSMMLQVFGNEVSTAYDGLEAVRAAEALRPDMVLMDIGMPRLDGYEAARQIRRQPWGKEMILIAATGWGQQEDRNRTKAAGFDHHLVKPLDPSALRQLIDELVPRKVTFGQA